MGRACIEASVFIPFAALLCTGGRQVVCNVCNVEPQGATHAPVAPVVLNLHVSAQAILSNGSEFKEVKSGGVMGFLGPKGDTPGVTLGLCCVHRSLDDAMPEHLPLATLCFMCKKNV